MRWKQKRDKNAKPGIERVQALADISRLRYVVIATKPAHRLQIWQYCTTRGHPYHSPTYIRVRAVVRECGEGQTDRQTDTQMLVTNVHFASFTTHAKCKHKTFTRSCLVYIQTRAITHAQQYTQYYYNTNYIFFKLHFNNASRLHMI